LLACLETSAHASQRLKIKAHPADTVAVYASAIEEQRMGDRVELVTGALEDWLPRASLVISEDSTAGMDAMVFGKPLVHAHFAHSEPVLPFVGFGAALPGFSPEELTDSLGRAQGMDSVALTAMHQGQSAFLDDFAGPMDGKQFERVADFLGRMLEL
jgi:hypothetical protein